MTYVCWNVQHEENSSLCIEIHTTAICNMKGKRESRSDDMCTIFSGKRMNYTQSMYSFSSHNPGRSLSQEGKIAVASSITVFAVTSILFFIIGFLSGCLCHKERKMAGTASPIEQPQIPYYDDVVLRQHMYIEQDLELKNNVAYVRPVQL